MLSGVTYLNLPITALPMAGLIKSGHISEKMEHSFQDIVPPIPGLAFIVTTTFVINHYKKGSRTMRKIIIILMCVISFGCFAYDHSYDVSGEDENGNELEGTIYSDNGERNVSGELTDENGNEYEFDGQWDGHGQISGETEDGVSVDLSTN